MGGTQPVVQLPEGPWVSAQDADDSAVGRSISRLEHAASVARMRIVLGVACVLWTGCFALDWAMKQVLAPEADLVMQWTLRGGFLVVLCAILALLHVRPPGPLLFRVLAYVCFVGGSIDVAVIAIQYGGLASPYAHGVSCIMVGAGIALPDHWRRSVPMLAATGLAYPATLAVASLWSPALAAQFVDGTASAEFLVDVALFLITGTLLVAGGHAFYRLRRQVFEARLVGRYRLRKRIAKGGMGEVWRAYHPTLRRDVAIKILRPSEGELGDSGADQAIGRFEREVAATAELAHPNTVRVLDFGVTDDGLWFYTMELLEGETLTTLVRREKGLDAARAVHLVHQGVRALAEAHGRGIVHRDLKPDNLFVTSLGGEADFVKVLDFGIAKALGGPPEKSLTSHGEVLGTPLFMSPEQGEGRQVDERSDVYSLGAVLYFALTGVPPFDGPTALSVLSAHATSPLVPPSMRTDRPIPRDVEEVVLRAMTKDPAARYRSALEMDEALSACDVAGKWKPGRRASVVVVPETDTFAPTISARRPN